MFTCVALYRGSRLSDLELVSLTTDRQLVNEVAQRFLERHGKAQDPAISGRQKGERRALRVIAREASHE